LPHNVTRTPRQATDPRAGNARQSANLVGRRKRELQRDTQNFRTRTQVLFEGTRQGMHSRDVSPPGPLSLSPPITVLFPRRLDVQKQFANALDQMKRRRGASASAENHLRSRRSDAGHMTTDRSGLVRALQQQLANRWLSRAAWNPQQLPFRPRRSPTNSAPTPPGTSNLARPIPPPRNTLRKAGWTKKLYPGFFARFIPLSWPVRAVHCQIHRTRQHRRYKTKANTQHRVYFFDWRQF